MPRLMSHEAWYKNSCFLFYFILEFMNYSLLDMDVIATLGVGGFGRVELVEYTKDSHSAFALKCLKKKHIVDTQQQEHLYSEKNIMMQCRCDFIAR